MKNSNPNRGIQNDNFNCGVWVLMEMFNRESGVNEPIGIRTIEELKKYRLRIFNLLIQIYSITLKDQKNKWLFECKEHEVEPCVPCIQTTI